MTVTAAEFTRMVRAAHAAAQQHEPSLAAAYQRGLRRCAAIARQNFVRHTKPGTGHALVADGAPAWALPSDDEVLSLLVASAEVEKATRRPRAKVVEAIIHDVAVELNLDFATTNRVIEGVLEQMGVKITDISVNTRRGIMNSLANSYDTGLSIPDAAKEMVKEVDALSVDRSTTIARTEMIGATNGGSLELARITGAAQTKTWLATDDDRVRPDHEDADGQTVAIDAPFLVGGAEMMFPGDPDGPADEVVNCRCTLTYGEASDDGGDAGMTASAKANRPMRLTHEDGRAADIPATVEMRGAVRFVTVDAAVTGEPGEPTRWHALLAPINAATDDGRILAPAEDGAISWRELPLTMMAQFETAMGHDGAVVAGRIDAITVATEDGVEGFYADGVFDDATGGSEAGAEAARLTRDGTLRGISIDLAVEEVELRTRENEPIPEDDEEAFWDALMGDGLMAVTRGTIMGATMTPFPAFADARVVVVASIDHAFAIVAAANAARSVAAAATMGAQLDSAEQAASPAAAPISATLPRRDGSAGPPTVSVQPMLVPSAPIVVSHDEALALGALAAGGFVSRNEVRDRLNLERVDGLDSLAIRGDELQLAQLVAAETAQRRDGDIAGSLRAVAEGLAASGRTGAAIEQALAEVRGAHSILASAVERVEVAASRPPRKLRVLRDEQGQATGYEEVQPEVKDEV